MGRRRVDDERLHQAVCRVVDREGGVRTLNRLWRGVKKELERGDEEVGVSPERVRRVAATSPHLRVQIHTRRGKTRRLQERCPVCATPLERVENRTLTGTRVVLEARCPACPYWTGRARRVPVRYAFHPRKDDRSGK